MKNGGSWSLRATALAMCGLLLSSAAAANVNESAADTLSPKIRRAVGNYSVKRLAPDTLLLEGGFQLGHDAVLKAAISPEIRTIIVNSAGGDLRSGIAMGKLIHANRLHVVVDGLCASSCANYLFVGGVTKEVKPNSVVLWHGGVTEKIVWDIPAQIRAYGAKLGLPERDIRRSSKEQVREWKQVLQEQRRFYRARKLPVILLEGFSSLHDLRGIPGAGSGGESMIFIDYAALRCAGVTGLVSSWTPPQGWWAQFFEASGRKRSIVRSSKLENSLCSRAGDRPRPSSD